VRTSLILSLILVSGGMAANGQSSPSAQTTTELLRLAEGERTFDVDLQITVDDLPYDEYWARTVDGIFSFADGDADGVLNNQEIRLVPSARAVRLSLGTAFTPPVAPIQSLQDVMTGEAQTCSKEELANYYRRHGAGRLTIGYGKLPNTAAITKAIIQALDQDRDGRLSQGELHKAETTLRRLDANDDDLIGVGELIPGGTYPGNWATNHLPPTATIDLSQSGDKSFVLNRERKTGSSERASWQITISDHVHDLPLKLATKARCESWTVQGPLSGLHDEFRDALANADATPSADAQATTRPRGRRPNRAWLTPLVDRDHNHEASQQEIDRWLALQRQLIHGQLMISVYYGGGLFELLDANHDAGLSIRELRTAWQNLESASCISENLFDAHLVPNVVLLIASQGYPSELARKSSPSEVEWFRQMDRNADGDVSRREFTGSPDAFSRLDRDRDDLISAHEAEASRK
jgi:hypothetical protein